MKYKRLFSGLLALLMIFSLFELNIFAKDVECDEYCHAEHEHEQSHFKAVEKTINIEIAENESEVLNKVNDKTGLVDDIIMDDNIIDIIPIGEEKAITRNLATNGFYYYINPYEEVIIMDTFHSDDIIQIYSGEFSDASYNSDIAYVAIGNQITAIDIEGDRSVLYIGEDSINNISAYEEIIYFTEGENLCSILPDGTDYEIIYEIGSITELVGISTTKSMWKTALLENEILSRKDYWVNRYNKEVVELYFMYDSIIGEVVEIADYDYYSTYLNYAPETDGPASGDEINSVGGSETYVINGVTLPLDNYPGNGTAYFNTVGVAAEDIMNPEVPGNGGCSSHSGGSNSTCRTYYHNGVPQGSQCWGFANFIYYKLFGEHFSYSTIQRYPDGDSDSKKMEKIPLGAHIRLDNDHHSVIFLGYDNEGFTVYEANGTGNCQVLIRKYLYTAGHTIDWYNYPTSHNDHSFVTNNYTTEHHIKVCSICGYALEELHNFNAAPYNYAQHFLICSVCGYGPTEAHQFVYTYSDGATHNISCEKCSYSSTEYHTTGYKDKLENSHTEYCLYCNHSWDAEEHNYYNSGTQNACKQCSDCGYAVVAHNLIMTYEGDEHYEKCSVCGYETDRYNHSLYNSSISSTQHQQFCTYCAYSGAKSNHSLSYKKVDSSYHRQECSECSYKSSNTSHSLSYKSVDSSKHKRVCSKCPYETSTSSHSFTYTKYSSSQHTKKCNSCGYSTKTSHSYTYGAWTDICTYEQCEKRYVECISCDYSYYEYDYSHDYVYGAWTYSSNGSYYRKRTGTCDDCGYKYTFYEY